MSSTKIHNHTHICTNTGSNSTCNDNVATSANCKIIKLMLLHGSAPSCMTLLVNPRTLNPKHNLTILIPIISYL